jgi:hypothetical protein
LTVKRWSRKRRHDVGLVEIGRFFFGLAFTRKLLLNG